MRDITIGKDVIGLHRPLYFIADIAANHDGELERAYKLIELAKEAGAHAAKFQNFQASKIVSRSGFESLREQLSHQSAWEKPVYETYEEASVSYEWTAKLKEKCDEVGITYFTSPYDFESVDHVDPFVPAYKIGSGDITWHGIIEHIAGKGKPVFLATGASTMEEVQAAMDVLRQCNQDIVLMQCNTNYTASAETFRYINLNVLKSYGDVFPDVLLGLSDHTLGEATVVGAVALGARIFEKHFTDDNGREGPDHGFSMTLEAWQHMVKRANEVYLALGDGKKIVEQNEEETAIVQRRGVRLTRSLQAGHVLEMVDLFPLRPRTANGISPDEIAKVIGNKLTRDKTVDECLCWEDLE